MRHEKCTEDYVAVCAGGMRNLSIAILWKTRSETCEPPQIVRTAQKSLYGITILSNILTS